jgi:hypothetical protein
MNQIVRQPPGSPVQQGVPSQQGNWFWDGNQWCCDPDCGVPPFPCPPPGFPPPGCPPWFGHGVNSPPWYPGANAGVSFGQNPPPNPVRGHFWWDGTGLALFDGAAWVNTETATIVPPGSTIGSVGGAGGGGGGGAGAGQIGEFVSSLVTYGTTVSISSGLAFNLTSISLSPGDWEVSGSIWYFGPGPTEVDGLKACITTMSATINTDPMFLFSENVFAFQYTPFSSGGPYGMSCGPGRLQLSTTTTVYMVGMAVTSVGGPSNSTGAINSYGGHIMARRWA